MTRLLLTLFILVFIAPLVAWVRDATAEQVAPRRKPQQLDMRRSKLPVGNVSLSPDGKRALSRNGDRLILWDVPLGKVLRIFDPLPNKPLSAWAFEVEIPPRGILSLAVDWKQGFAVTGDGNAVIRVWDLATGKLRHAIPLNQPDRIELTSEHGVSALALSPDGKRIYSSRMEPLVPFAGAEKDVAVDVWDAQTGKYLRTLGQRNRKDGAYGYRKIILLKGGDRVLLVGVLDLALWDLATNKPIWKQRIDQWLVATNGDGSKLLIYASPKLMLYTGKLEKSRTLSQAPPEVNPRKYVSALTFFPNDAERALTGGAGELIVWDLKDRGKPIATWETGTENRIRAIAFSGDAKSALVGTTNGGLYLFDTDTGKMLRSLELKDDEATK